MAISTMWASLFRPFSPLSELSQVQVHLANTGNRPIIFLFAGLILATAAWTLLTCTKVSSLHRNSFLKGSLRPSRLPKTSPVPRSTRSKRLLRRRAEDTKANATTATSATPNINTKDTPSPEKSLVDSEMRYPPQVPLPPSFHIQALRKLEKKIAKQRQPFDAFLVLDIEGTCQEGTDFNYPNEIIEFPVCLMRWKDKSHDHTASQLEVVAEFRSFVRPTWRPQLSDFCTTLTGIEQSQVDNAPTFPDVLNLFEAFLYKHGLVDRETGDRRIRFCWCSDGPFDVRDFVVKQCFISKIDMPRWMQGEVLDVRTLVLDHLYAQQRKKARSNSLQEQLEAKFPVPRRRSLNISGQLRAMELPTFQGRQHCGIDDARNISRILAALASKGVALLPNTPINPSKRWLWMGKRGRILEELLIYPNAVTLPELPVASAHL